MSTTGSWEEENKYYLLDNVTMGDIRIDSLLGTAKWDGAVGIGASISYSFPTQSAWENPGVWRSYGSITGHLEPWTSDFGALAANEQAYVRSAFDAWGEVADLKFASVADISDAPGDGQITPGVIRVAKASTGRKGPDGDPLAGWAFPPGGSVFNGDVWLNGDLEQVPENGALQPGGGAYRTLLHEIGHAIGLKHPRNYYEEEQYINQLPENMDNGLNTVMSYNGVPRGGGNHPVTPMLFDILTVQYLYGENTATRAGDTQYIFTNEYLPVGGNLYQVRYDVGSRTVWDAGGIDSFNASQVREGSFIDLEEGGASSVGGENNNIAIAFGATIENAVGGGGDDWIKGNGSANWLSGGPGQDTLSGGPGSDTLDGGEDADTVDYSDLELRPLRASGVTIDLQAGAATLNQTSEGWSSFRDYADWITTTAANNRDQLISIENAVGSSGSDVIYGDAAANVINGGAGEDTLDGREGADTVSYEGADGFVWLDLARETASIPQTHMTPHGPEEVVDTEVVKGFENSISGSWGSRVFGDLQGNRLTGGSGTDRLMGRDGDDSLEGGAGNDFLYGGYTPGSPDDAGLDDGDDRLDGGPGDDVLDGGSGDDWAYYNNSEGELRLDLEGGRGTLSETEFNSGGPSGRQVAYDDRLINIENIVGSDGVNWLYGTEGNNNLSGGAADDHLFGRAGLDTLGGGEGTDELYGEAENDRLIGGPGNDILNGGADTDTADYRYSNGLLEVDLEKGEASISAVPAGGGGWLPVEDTDVLTDIENVTGSSGPSNIYGNELPNVLDGLDGPNSLYGRGGNDTLWGGSDRNWLYGEENDDILRGGDVNDRLDGGTGADEMQGFGGDDVYVVDNPEDEIIEFPGEGTDRVRTATTVYPLPDDVENLELLGDVWLHGIGNDLDNILEGNKAPNALFGLGGNDLFDGEGGADDIFGGAGKDTLTGGADADRFWFSQLDTGFGRLDADVINDFSRWDGDRIDLSATSVTRFGGAGESPARNEVSFFSEGRDTVVRFNHEEEINDIVLADVNLTMAESDFVLL